MLHLEFLRKSMLFAALLFISCKIFAIPNEPLEVENEYTIQCGVNLTLFIIADSTLRLRIEKNISDDEIPKEYKEVISNYGKNHAAVSYVKIIHDEVGDKLFTDKVFTLKQKIIVSNLMAEASAKHNGNRIEMLKDVTKILQKYAKETCQKAKYNFTSIVGMIDTLDKDSANASEIKPSINIQTATTSKKIENIKSEQSSKRTESKLTNEAVRKIIPEKNRNSLISREVARKKIIEELDLEARFKIRPEDKQVIECAIDDYMITEIFQESTEIPIETFKLRLPVVTDAMTNKKNNNNPEFMFKLMRCFINSNEAEQIVKKDKFDNKSSGQSESAMFLPLLDLDDLRIDINSMEGKKVRVNGVGNYMMNMLTLKKSLTDTNLMVVNISKLERRQRLKIIQQCSDILSGCRVIIIGKIGKIGYQDQLIAESVELN